MKIIRLVISISLSLIFVVSTLVAVFSAGRIVNAVLDTYVFEVDNCYYPRPVAIEDPAVGEKPEMEECTVDYNQAKRDVSGGLAQILVLTPIAIFSYKKSMKLLKEEA